MIGLILSTLTLAAAAIAENTLALDLQWLSFVQSVFWFALALTVHYTLVIVLWRGLLPRWTGNQIPRVLVQLGAVVLLVIALFTVLVSVFELPMSSVVTTSSVFIAIVGFALRNMISDLFTGIALGIEQPFSLGDWIRIQDGTVGQVVEMNWRSTRLLTGADISIVVPNSELAISTFKNYSKPERSWRDEFEILLDQSVTSHQAERILLSAVRQIPRIVALNKTPEVRITEYTENGVVWQLRYWVPDYPQKSELRYEVQKSILRNMHYAGLSIPAEQVRITSNDSSVQDGTFLFLRDIDLFAQLSDEELRQLQYSMDQRLIKRAEDVVHQGQSGESLFIVKEGLLQVNIAIDDNQTINVAHLVPGSFFGEMSLLTGDPRNATVTTQVDSLIFEVTKKDLEPILRGRPEIASILSESLAERQSRNQHQSENAMLDEEELEATLLRRIRTFFALGGEAIDTNSLEAVRR